MEKSIISPKGRIGRSTYWIRFLIAVLFYAVGGSISKIGSNEFFEVLISMAVTYFIIVQGIKRVHDVNLSGWYSIIPFYNIGLFLIDGTRGHNDYGNDPKILELLKPGSKPPLQDGTKDIRDDIAWQQQKELYKKGICPLCKEKIDPKYTKCFACDFDFYENKLTE